MKALQLIKNLDHSVITMFCDSIKSSMEQNNLHFDDLKVYVSMDAGLFLHVNCDITQGDVEKTYTICVAKGDILYALCDADVYGKYHDDNQSVMEIVDNSSSIEDVVQRFIKYITHK